MYGPDAPPRQGGLLQGTPSSPAHCLSFAAVRATIGEAWCHRHCPGHSRLLSRLLLVFPNYGSRRVIMGKRPGRWTITAVISPLQPAFGTGSTATITIKLYSNNLEPSFPLLSLLQGYRLPGLVGEARVYMCVHTDAHGLGVGKAAFAPIPGFRLSPLDESLQQMCWPKLYSTANPNPNFSNVCPQCYVSFIHSCLASFQSPAPTSAHP